MDGKKWTANAPVFTASMAVCLCMSAALSLADRIAAHDLPQISKSDLAPHTGQPGYRMIIDDQPFYRLVSGRWVEIAASQNGHYITNVMINGAKVLALIDTGATSVALSYEDAERAGLNPFRLKFRRRVRTANGIARVAKVNLKQVVVEGIIVKNVDGIVMRKGAMYGTLLGMSFLRRLNGFRVERGILYLEE